MKTEHFIDMLAVGGKANSLGRVTDVIEAVLQEPSRLEELYQCLFSEDAWVRMRAADALEKICRDHPDWILPYIDRLAHDFSASTQPSIQWHLAQIYREVELSNTQRNKAIDWLETLLSDKSADWIAAANAMDTLMEWTRGGYFPATKMKELLHIQQHHASNAVVKRTVKYLTELDAQ